ncbi:MAG: hypothetical protein P4L83_04485 [Nevskia sp.]|nr:hypothetical protein [Nevskia sp.]
MATSAQAFASPTVTWGDTVTPVIYAVQAFYPAYNPTGSAFYNSGMQYSAGPVTPTSGGSVAFRLTLPGCSVASNGTFTTSTGMVFQNAPSVVGDGIVFSATQTQATNQGPSGANAQGSCYANFTVNTGTGTSAATGTLTLGGFQVNGANSVMNPPNGGNSSGTAAGTLNNIPLCEQILTSAGFNPSLVQPAPTVANLECSTFAQSGNDLVFSTLGSDAGGATSADIDIWSFVSNGNAWQEPAAIPFSLTHFGVGVGNSGSSQEFVDIGRTEVVNNNFVDNFGVNVFVPYPSSSNNTGTVVITGVSPSSQFTPTTGIGFSYLSTLGSESSGGVAGPACTDTSSVSAPDASGTFSAGGNTFTYTATLPAVSTYNTKTYVDFETCHVSDAGADVANRANDVVGGVSSWSETITTTTGAPSTISVAQGESTALIPYNYNANITYFNYVATGGGLIPLLSIANNSTNPANVVCRVQGNDGFFGFAVVYNENNVDLPANANDQILWSTIFADAGIGGASDPTALAGLPSSAYCFAPAGVDLSEINYNPGDGSIVNLDRQVNEAVQFRSSP